MPSNQRCVAAVFQLSIIAHTMLFAAVCSRHAGVRRAWRQEQYNLLLQLSTSQVRFTPVDIQALPRPVLISCVSPLPKSWRLRGFVPGGSRQCSTESQPAPTSSCTRRSAHAVLLTAQSEGCHLPFCCSRVPCLCSRWCCIDSGSHSQG